jgi:hypothetical protein
MALLPESMRSDEITEVCPVILTREKSPVVAAISIMVRDNNIPHPAISARENMGTKRFISTSPL